MATFRGALLLEIGNRRKPTTHFVNDDQDERPARNSAGFVARAPGLRQVAGLTGADKQPACLDAAAAAKIESAQRHCPSNVFARTRLANFFTFAFRNAAQRNAQRQAQAAGLTFVCDTCKRANLNPPPALLAHPNRPLAPIRRAARPAPTRSNFYLSMN